MSDCSKDTSETKDYTQHRQGPHAGKDGFSLMFAFSIDLVTTPQSSSAFIDLLKSWSSSVSFEISSSSSVNVV
jgi:hypothetical protein